MGAVGAFLSGIWEELVHSYQYGRLLVHSYEYGRLLVHSYQYGRLLASRFPRPTDQRWEDQTMMVYHSLMQPPHWAVSVTTRRLRFRNRYRNWTLGKYPQKIWKSASDVMSSGMCEGVCEGVYVRVYVRVWGCVWRVLLLNHTAVPWQSPHSPLNVGGARERSGGLLQGWRWCHHYVRPITSKLESSCSFDLAHGGGWGGLVWFSFDLERFLRLIITFITNAVVWSEEDGSQWGKFTNFTDPRKLPLTLPLLPSVREETTVYAVPAPWISFWCKGLVSEAEGLLPRLT